MRLGSLQCGEQRGDLAGVGDALVQVTRALAQRRSALFVLGMLARERIALRDEGTQTGGTQLRGGRDLAGGGVAGLAATLGEQQLGAGALESLAVLRRRAQLALDVDQPLQAEQLGDSLLARGARERLDTVQRALL